MDGSAELCQLAHLLRTGADAAGRIIDMRPCDTAQLLRLIAEARDMADRLEAIAGGRLRRDAGEEG